MASIPIEVPFTNSIDQVINPGDQVVIVTTGYGHQVSTTPGTYLGLHPNGGVQCIKKVKTGFYVVKGTDEKIHHSFFNEMNSKLSAFAAEWRKNNPGKYAYYSEPEYKAIRDEYMNQIETASGYIDRRTTLQRNRIFKLAA